VKIDKSDKMILQSADLQISPPALLSSSSSLPLPPTLPETHPEEEEKKAQTSPIRNLPSCVPVIEEPPAEQRNDEDVKPKKKQSRKSKKADEKLLKPPEPFVPPRPSPAAMSRHDRMLGELKGKLEPIREEVEVRSDTPSIAGFGIPDSESLTTAVTSSAKDIHSELLHIMRGKRKEEDALAEARSSSSALLDSEEQKRKIQRTSNIELSSVPAQSISASTLHQTTAAPTPQRAEDLSNMSEVKRATEHIDWHRVMYIYVAILLTFMYSVVLGVAMCFRILCSLSLEGVMRARNFVQDRTKHKKTNNEAELQLSHIKQE